MNKVSIIIPIYNGEKYIDECLQSVGRQDYKNIEILIINDGSTDSSLQRCQHWQKKDSKIIIFNNENHGVSYSRNFGVEKCTGEYIAFIDADDIIAHDYITVLVDMMEGNPACDLSIVNLSAFSSSPKVCCSGKNEILSSTQAKQALHTYIGGFICGRLYRANILKRNNVRLNEDIAVCEDLLFNVEYLKYCHTVIYNTGAKYFYRQHNLSAFHNVHNPKWFDCIKAYQIILREYQDEQEIFLVVIFNYLKILFEAKYRAKFLKKKELIKKIKNEIKDNKKYRKKFSLKQKLKLLILEHFYPIVVFYRKIKRKLI